MREQAFACGHCGAENPAEARFCAACSRPVVRSSGGMSKAFIWTLSLVGLLWVGTPLVVGIQQWLTVDSRSTYGPEFGVFVVTGMSYFFYGFIGVIAGLITLFFKRSIGAGLLAGTAVGLLAGFATCLAVAGAVE